MNLRGRITEEINNLKFERLLMMTYAIMKSMNKEQHFDVDVLESIVEKAAKQLGISIYSDNDIIEKVVACFELSPTFDINSPEFNKNPELKTFEVEAVAAWSGYGRDFYSGELQAYTKRALENFLYNDGGYTELDMYDRDFRNYEVDEVDIEGITEITKPINEDTIKGGLSDNKSLKDIAKKHKVSEKELKKQLDKGIEVEMEHTDKKSTAKEIAMDHLFEDPKYYDKLETIEGKDFDRVKMYLEYYQNITPDEFKVKRKGNEIIITLPEERKS
jgi:hypothetical protein